MENLKFNNTSNRKHEAPANTVIYSELPSVLVQDPKQGISYLISSHELSKFKTDEKTWTSLPENTLTFLIPDEDFIDEVPWTQCFSEPSVLIQFPKGNASYFIKNQELEKFKVEDTEDINNLLDNCVSFIIPSGDDFLEDIPTMKSAMLQSNTNVNW